MVNNKEAALLIIKNLLHDVSEDKVLVIDLSSTYKDGDFEVPPQQTFTIRTRKALDPR